MDDTLPIIQELQSRSKRRRDKAFKRIYNEHLRDLVTIAHGLLNDLHLAEDAVEDVFARIYKSPDKYKVKRNLRGYLAVCVVRRCRVVVRTRQPQSISVCEASSKCSNAKGPGAEAIISEESQMVSPALGQLPYEERAVIMLRVWTGMSYKDIADALGIKIGTARSRYSRGLQSLLLILSPKINW